MPGRVTFYTVSDARFFVGTACLVNSLRLTGNRDQIVVLDLGLTASQRERLSAEATVIERPAAAREFPLIFKPYPALLEPTGAVVVIDSDMIVTRSLDPITDMAAAGKFVLFSDIEPQNERWFAEWEGLFGLPVAPRHQPYLNTGLVAFSVDHWPHMLARWWEACDRVPQERTIARGARSSDPFCFSDQDALNALLMSEVPRDAVVGLPEEEGPSAGLLSRVRVDANDALRCRLDGHEPYLLHYWGGPKPWERSAWIRVERNAYVRLMPRVLYGSAAPIPVEPHELPRWLRPGLANAALLGVLSAGNRLLRLGLDRLSFDARNRASKVKRRIIA